MFVISPETFSPLAALRYNSLTSTWLSVDPLSDKYPNLSPYVYCADNPVRYFDPNGEEIGDYYDLNGKYLGTDGIEDNKVHIIIDNDSQTYITGRTRNKQLTPTSDVKIKLTTKYEYLQRASLVYEQGRKEQGAFENGGAYDMNDVWHQGIGFKNHVELSISEGNATVHLHPWNTGEEQYGAYASPSNPSEKDLSAFKNYQQNIIVGMSAGSYDSFSGFTRRKPQICFYGSQKNPHFTMDISVVNTIVQRGVRTGKLR